MDIKPRIRVPGLSTPVFTGDGFINFVSRVGTGADKAAHGRYVLHFFDQMEIEAAYRTSWFRKICDIVPFDEVREWRTWTGADEDQINAIDAEEKRLNLRGKLKQARTLARKDGGSAIVISDGTDASEPLDPESIVKDGIKFITVLNRFQITPQEMQQDPLDELDGGAPFGTPKGYYLAGVAGQANAQVHPSRVLRFIGNPILQANYWDGWGDSLWVELRDAIRRSDGVSAGTAALMEEAKVDIIKLANLANNLQTDEGTDLLVRRFGSAGLLKSIVNALILDKDDDYEQKTQTFQGLSDINEIMLMTMAGMADIPQTRLFGRAPAGMNATGDSDLRNYYDRIKAFQTVETSPTLHPLDEMIIRSATGKRDVAIYYEWNPLYQMSEQEAATVEKTFADAANVYGTAGVIPSGALAKIVQGGIVERGQWPGAQKAFDEAEAEGDIPDITAEPTPEEQALSEANIAAANARAADPTGALAAADGNKRPQFGDAEPRTLYVSRQLLNAGDVLAWAKKQGFTSTLPAADMHVTIAFSRSPLDWMAVPEAWSFGNEKNGLVVPASGQRLVERFGGGAVVLEFVSSDLAWRWGAIREAGASWDWPSYQPHVTISYSGAPEDIDAIEPYRGELKFGPEIWTEVKEDWAKGISEDQT